LRILASILVVASIKSRKLDISTTLLAQDAFGLAMAILLQIAKTELLTVTSKR
jgi:hypothetical protein